VTSATDENVTTVYSYKLDTDKKTRKTLTPGGTDYIFGSISEQTKIGDDEVDVKTFVLNSAKTAVKGDETLLSWIKQVTSATDENVTTVYSYKLDTDKKTRKTLTPAARITSSAPSRNKPKSGMTKST